MKEIHKNKKELALDLLAIMFIAGTIGIALKFYTILGKTIYFPDEFGWWFLDFPFFPNILDILLLISTVLYLGCYIIKLKCGNLNEDKYS